MTAIVSLSKVSKSYVRGKQQVAVLRDLDLSIEAGDFAALMGPSGSGKTTLLNLIGGLDQPTSGSITVAGQQLEKLNSKSLAKWRAENIGFVFQFYNLLPVLTAQRNVEMPLLLATGQLAGLVARTILQSDDLQRRCGILLPLGSVQRRQ
jgi:putative ABC transport system ATP-binding protein